MKNFFNKLNYGIQRFMAGRNGNDQLNIFIFFVYLFVVLLTSLLKLESNIVVNVLKALFCAFYLFRFFSKRLSKRRNENQAFCSIYQPIVNWFKKKIRRLKKMKDYKYFKCPNCKTELRVPRGKGEIEVTCPNCHHKFDKKS